MWGRPRKVNPGTYIGGAEGKMQAGYWSICAAAIGVAAFASYADRRRARRRNLDKVGFMPWPLIMIIAMLAAAVLAALALKPR